MSSSPSPRSSEQAQVWETTYTCPSDGALVRTVETSRPPDGSRTVIVETTDPITRNVVVETTAFPAREEDFGAAVPEFYVPRDRLPQSSVADGGRGDVERAIMKARAPVTDADSVIGISAPARRQRAPKKRAAAPEVCDERDLLPPPPPTDFDAGNKKLPSPPDVSRPDPGNSVRNSSVRELDLADAAAAIARDVRRPGVGRSQAAATTQDTDVDRAQTRDSTARDLLAPASTARVAAHRALGLSNTRAATPRNLSGVRHGDRVGAHHVAGFSGARAATLHRPSDHRYGASERTLSTIRVPEATLVVDMNGDNNDSPAPDLPPQHGPAAPVLAVATRDTCGMDFRNPRVRAFLAAMAVVLVALVALAVGLVLALSRGDGDGTAQGSSRLGDEDSAPFPSLEIPSTSPPTVPEPTAASTPGPTPAIQSSMADSAAESTTSLPSFIQSSLPPTVSPSAELMELCDFDETSSVAFFGLVLWLGLWFQAPTDFCIVGLRVPNEADQSTQNVEVFVMDLRPPQHPATGSGGSVFHAAGKPTAGDRVLVPDPMIEVPAGEYVGLLGFVGSDIMHSSDCASGTSGTFITSIAGHDVTLNGFGTNNYIVLGPATNYFSWNDWGIGRVEMFYAPGRCGA